MDDDQKREVIHQLANPHLQEPTINDLSRCLNCGAQDVNCFCGMLDEEKEDYHSVSTTEVRASRWLRFKRAMGDWWERARVRLCCWILRIDEFRIDIKVDKLKGWIANFPRIHMVIEEGMISFENEDDFEHMRGKVTLKDGSNMTVSAPPEPIEWSPDSPVTFYDMVAGTPSPPSSTLRANSAGSIRTPPPTTLKGMLKSANGSLWMGDPKSAHYYVDMALRHMGDAWDVKEPELKGMEAYYNADSIGDYPLCPDCNGAGVDEANTYCKFCNGRGVVISGPKPIEEPEGRPATSDEYDTLRALLMMYVIHEANKKDVEISKEAVVEITEHVMGQIELRITSANEDPEPSDYPNRWGPEFAGSPCGSCGHNTDGDAMNSDLCAELGCEGDFSEWIPPPTIENCKHHPTDYCAHPDRGSPELVLTPKKCKELIDAGECPLHLDVSYKRPLDAKMMHPTNPPKFPDELPPKDEALAEPKVTPEDVDEENEGPCAHPDNYSGECNLECNHFDDETDRLEDGECKWHYENEESPPEGSCYRNQHPDVDADDAEVHQCGGKECPYWDSDSCPYLKPPEGSEKCGAMGCWNHPCELEKGHDGDHCHENVGSTVSWWTDEDAKKWCHKCGLPFERPPHQMNAICECEPAEEEM